MTASIRQPLLMYADAAIRFRDPFVSKDAYSIDSKASWPSYYQQPDFTRALTPPPEMNEVSHASKYPYYEQEHGDRYRAHMPTQHAQRAHVAPYVPQEVSNVDFGRNGVATQPNSRAISPVQHPRQPLYNDTQHYEPQQTHQKRDSQANAIASQFQIPKSVNDSGGSLSELAAQITCLFWFESSDLLQQIEDSTIPLQPTRPLVSDAKPSTGFRKWVTTILSTTLVAQNVVLLALFFIYRLKKLNPTVRGKPGSEYRLLTVALMLGNKFLDDNTYTNKTWAEVSGICVSEVHIMEVEFLSNMKYCLFTSAEDWSKWQSLLGRFAAFFERASKPQPPPSYPAPILPPASSLHLPMALPSPPASNQASPPYVTDMGQNGSAYGVTGQIGPTPAPSPLAVMSTNNTNYQNCRKRSLDEYASEPPPKRMASGYQRYQSPEQYSTSTTTSSQNQPIPRLTLPSLAIPYSQAPASSYTQATTQSQQLPPLPVPNRAMALVYPNASTQAQLPMVSALAGPSSQPASQMHSQYQSRHQSPYLGSGAPSPTSTIPESAPAPALRPAAQISPEYFLQQRNSPYRPIHHVSTLLYPPPSTALQTRPQNIEYNQMHYQPLGKSIQQRQTGRLPYVSQNVWLDGNQQQAMTPVHQWPGFMNTKQQQSLLNRRFE